MGNEDDLTERLLSDYSHRKPEHSSIEAPSRTHWKTTLAFAAFVVLLVAALIVGAASLLVPYLRNGESSVSNPFRWTQTPASIITLSSGTQPNGAGVVSVSTLCKNPYLNMRLPLPSWPNVKAPEASKRIRESVWRKALGACLNEGYHVPWAFISSLDTSSMETLMRNLLVRTDKLRSFEHPYYSKKLPRIIFVHVQNGLGNRLRALGSGLAFADGTVREAVIVWESDTHLRTAFSDIVNISQTSNVVIGKLNQFGSKARDSAWGNVDIYNYMIPGEKDVEVVHNESNHIYFKSAFVMKSTYSSWDLENKHIRQLPFRDDIIRLVRSVLPTDLRAVGGVHIRNRSLSEDIENLRDYKKEYGSEEAATLQMWRSRTSYMAFVPEMRKLLKRGIVSKFFVATDTVAVVPKLERLVGKERIFWLPRACDDRSAECVKYAMADILVLAKTKVLLGSTWSSFTEAAMRLGAPKALMAGTDFSAVMKSNLSTRSTLPGKGSRQLGK